MARNLSNATINIMRNVVEDFTDFDVDIYFDDADAEIVMYHNCELEFNRVWVNSLVQLTDVLSLWQEQYEQFLFDYSESERPERANSQAINNLKIKIAYANATRFLDEATTQSDFDNAWLHLMAAEDLVWLQFMEVDQ